MGLILFIVTIKSTTVTHPLNGAQPGLYVKVRVTRGCSGRTSVYLCTASLQNLAVPDDFYSPLSVPMERSCWLSIRWCGTGGFQEQGQCSFIGLSCSISTISSTKFPFLFFLSIGWYCGAAVFGLIGCISLSLSLALPTSFNNNNNNLLPGQLSLLALNIAPPRTGKTMPV